MNILILAGGEGTRLWPLSRRDIPKQFHYFGDKYSLLQKSLLRYLSWPSLSKIVVLTNCDHRQIVEQQIAKLAPSKRVEIIVEPARRNTTAAIALGVQFLQESLNNLDIPILITPSDHLIESSEIFSQAIQNIPASSLESQIILFGIQPDRPETGYGYIKLGTPLTSTLYRVESFEEKPTHERAKLFLKDPKMVWNSGMLLFSPRTFWNEIKLHAPEFSIAALNHFHQLPNLSIDYALLEKSQNLAVQPLSISWSDVGCWDSIYEISDKDQNHNAKVGNICEIDTRNSLIIGNKKLICAIGVEDLLIVDTEDALFISKKGESQKIKALLQQMEIK